MTVSSTARSRSGRVRALMQRYNTESFDHFSCKALFLRIFFSFRFIVLFWGRVGLGIAYISCKNSRLNGTDWSECSESADPDWDGFPVHLGLRFQPTMHPRNCELCLIDVRRQGCHLAGSFEGWQACSQFNGCACAHHSIRVCMHIQLIVQWTAV